MAPVLAVSLLACRATPSAPPAPPIAAHLVLVTIDTLRADRLGAYGSTSVVTPHLDRLAGDGTLVVDASVGVPLTRPSHTSLFTGLYPARHGIRDNVSTPLAATIPTLAERLTAAGFHTAAFVSSIVLARQSGLDRGFAVYDDRFESPGDEVLFLNTLQKRGDRTLGEFDAWIRSERASAPDARLAAWIHLYDPHDPYEPPEPYATRYADHPYDGEVAWTDELVGRLRSTLEEAGQFDRTLLVVTSDHGEALGEHDETGHGYFVYETVLRVPLIVHGPGVKPQRLAGHTVRTVDVLPTLVDLLGLSWDAAKPLDGRSVAGALRGGSPGEPSPTYAESLTPLLHYGWSDLRSLRDGKWKYILAPRPELYDIDADPGETRNLADSQSSTARALRAALEDMLKQERAAPQTSADRIAPELLEKLGALGYVSPGGAAGSANPGADPKDKLPVFKRLSAAMRGGIVALSQQDFRTSTRRFQELLDEGSDGFEVHFYMGRALAGLGRHADAVRQFDAAIARMPAYTPAVLALADARVALGQPRAALAALEAGQRQAPGELQLVEHEGEVQLRMGQLDEAVKTFERAASQWPSSAGTRVRLGELYRDQGRSEQAAKTLRDALALDSTQASYWNALGMVLGGSGQLADAQQAFQEAVTRDPKNAEYLYNLGLALLRQGRIADAAPNFERALAVAPSFAPARDRLAEIRASQRRAPGTQR